MSLLSSVPNTNRVKCLPSVSGVPLLFRKVPVYHTQTLNVSTLSFSRHTEVPVREWVTQRDARPLSLTTREDLDLSTEGALERGGVVPGRVYRQQLQ